ncbi:MAG: hypothetical protein HGA67_03690 [Candidatus Yonathbacteria bacterium]|nr:hypothetical protein [Candidatus Yonathbacteria bacterium]
MKEHSYNPKEFTLAYPELKRSTLAWKNTFAGHRVLWRVIAVLGISLTAHYAGKKDVLTPELANTGGILMLAVGIFFLLSTIKFLIETRDVCYAQHLREILKNQERISRGLSEDIGRVDALSRHCVGRLSTESLLLITAHGDKRDVEKAGININEERISLRAHAQALMNLYNESIPWALSEYGISNITRFHLAPLDVHALRLSLKTLCATLKQAGDIDLAAAQANEPVVIKVVDCWDALTNCHRDFTQKLWDALNRTQSNMRKFITSIHKHIDYLSSR